MQPKQKQLIPLAKDLRKEAIKQLILQRSKKALSDSFADSPLAAQHLLPAAQKDLLLYERLFWAVVKILLALL